MVVWKETHSIRLRGKIAMKQWRILCLHAIIVLFLVTLLSKSYVMASPEPISEPHIYIENDIKRSQTIFFQNDFIVCKHATILSLENGERVTLDESKYGLKKIGITGWKKKVKIKQSYYFVSELLLQASHTDEPALVRYKEPRTIRLINETVEEKRLRFTFFRDGRYVVTVLLKPGETMDVPYKKWSIYKQICLEHHKETSVDLEGREVLKVHDSSIEVTQER